jgi:hypothetical protein
LGDQRAGEGSAGEMMIVGLIDHADRLGKSAQSTQQVLTEQIQELAQLQQWTVNAALELQKRADATIQKFEAERAQLHGTQANLERNAMQAIHDAVRKQSDGIERQTVQALAAPLRDIQQAAAQVRQNVKEASWLMIGLILSAGLVIGFLLGYWPLSRSQNSMQEQLNRIEQNQAAQQPSAPAAPDVHTPAHKGKTK